MMWHIFENGWEDKEYIRQRVFGMDEIRKEVAKWTPEVTQDVTGVAPDDMKRAAQTMAENRPGTLVWCMGGTQHHIGTNNTRAYCVLQLALGNIGKSGGGANIFRGHDNVQGATDVGPNSNSLPGYYGLAEASWKYWAGVWGVDFEWLKGRFDFSRTYLEGTKEQYPMFTEGVPVSRWIDGILEAPENFQQKSNFRAIFFQGHAVNSQTRGAEMKKALEKVELVVISDPYPTHMAVMSERKNNTYLLPTCTQFEQVGSVTASNRSLQWRERVFDPLFESKPDAAVLYLFAKKLGFGDEFVRNIAVEGDMPSPEDTLREINNSVWTIGYTGQSPERLKLHAKHRHTFNVTTLRAEGGPCDGDFYGLPWPCWGTAEMKHPGTHVLYDPSLPVKDGGLNFRANFGVEYEGQNLLAEDSWSKGAEIQDGYPEFTADILKQLGWWDDLTDDEKKAAEGKNWKTDRSGGIQRVVIAHGCAPFGNAKARCIVWEWPDVVPLHREPLYTPRHDLVAKFPTIEDRKAFWRLPTRYASIQKENHSAKYPLAFISGRLVEYEGGGEETRSNPWLAELQQNMFVEINPADANDRSIRDGQWVWLEGAEGSRIKVMAMVTNRVGRGVVWTPFHFGGWFQGEDLLARYPEGTAPYVRGEACNTATTYGYDLITQMQETKATLCQITAA
jgi:formate dehydrogenase major subunit